MTEQSGRSLPVEGGWRLPVILMILGALLLLPFVGRHSLWVDEIFSLAMATGHSLEHPASDAVADRGDYIEEPLPVPPARLRSYIEQPAGGSGVDDVVRAVYLSDTSPPLYYVALHGWVRLAGTSTWALRLFSVLWAVACLPLIVAVCCRIGCPRTAWCAGCLFIFAPLSVYYSSEGRMYPLLWFCVLATALLSIRLHQSGGRFGLGVLWVASSAAGLLVHYFFVFPWLGMVTFLAFAPGQDRRAHLAMRLAGVTALILPWYLRVPESLKRWRVTQDWLSWKPGGFDWLTEATANFTQFFTGDGRMLWQDHRKATAMEWVVFVLLALVLCWRLRKRAFGEGRSVIWIWFIAACAGPVVFDFLRHTYTVAVPRYSAAALPAGCLLAALALNCIPFLPRVAVLAVILAGWAINLRSIYAEESRMHLPLGQAVQAINAVCKDGDLIIVQSIPSGIVGFAHYIKDGVSIAPWVEQLQVQRVPDTLPGWLAGRSSVFFVKLHLVGALTPAEDWLRANGTVKQSRQFAGLTFTEFALTPK